MNRQEHLIQCLEEECAEVIHACSKIIISCSKANRFGLDDGYPGSYSTNAQDISKEFAELSTIFQMLVQEGALPEPDWGKIKPSKIERVEKYMRYAKERGALND